MALKHIVLPKSDVTEEFTGERYLPSVGGEIAWEHIHRYAAALEFCIGKDVLDIACGEGYGSYMLSQVARSVCGVDIDEPTIQRAQGRYVRDQLVFKTGRCESIPCDAKSVDVVVSFETIEHIAEPEAFLQEVLRVLRPGGMLIISSPEREGYNIGLTHGNPFHVSELSAEEFSALLHRYFRNVSSGRQTVRLSSIILPSGTAAGSQVFSPEDGTLRVDPFFRNSPYIVAICTNSAEPILVPISMYDGGLAPTILSALQGGIAEREEEIGKLRKRLARSEGAARARVDTKDLSQGEWERLKKVAAGMLHDVRRGAWKPVVRRVQGKVIHKARRFRWRAMRVGARYMSLVPFVGYGVIKLMIRSSGIFDRDYYLSQLDQERNRAEAHPLRHYLAYGDRHNISPHPLFEPSLYRRYNMSGKALTKNALFHYLLGQWSGRGITSVMFDSQFYLLSHPDVAAAGINPLAHYVRWGWRENRAIVPWFDSQAYCAEVKCWSPGNDPASNFLKGGYKEFPTPQAPIPVDLVREFSHFSLVSEVSLCSDEVKNLMVEISSLLKGCATLRGMSGSKPVVSIIIPVFNQLRYTLQCFKSIALSQPKVAFEIIVVDDCSTDQTREALKMLENVRVIEQESNTGFIGSCNRGASMARGDYLVFLNNDTYVLEGWLDELLNTLRANAQVAIAGSQLLYPDGVLQEAGGIVWKDASAWNYGRYQAPWRPEFSYLRSVDYCSGASIMISKQRFEELGSFDPLYAPAYCEDVDLAFKARERGYDVVYQPASRVVHFEGVSSGTDITKGVKAYQVVNLQRLHKKWEAKLARHGENGKHVELERNRGKVGHVLFIDACVPTPDQDAGSVVANSWLTILVSLGYQVTFVAMHQFSYMPRYTGRLTRMGVYVPTRPYHQSPESFIKEFAKSFDVIVANRYGCAAPAYKALEEGGGTAPRIFIPADLHYLREARAAEIEGNSAKRLASIRTQYDELKTFLDSDLTCVHSSMEKKELVSVDPTAHVEVTPIIMPVPGRTAPFGARRDICFIGGFRHAPNVDAMLFFVRDVWPLVRQKLPDVALKIIGSNPPPEILSLDGESVHVMGFVEDLEPILSAIKLSVAPLRYGAGVKGKVSLSMTYGVPVVGTPVAFEGMNLTSGKEAIVGASPAELSSQIVAIYSDEALWTQVSDAVWSRAHSEYSVEANTPRIANFLAMVGIRATEQGVASEGGNEVPHSFNG